MSSRLFDTMTWCTWWEQLLGQLLQNRKQNLGTAVGLGAALKHFFKMAFFRMSENAFLEYKISLAFIFEDYLGTK